MIRACELYLGRTQNLGAKPELFSLKDSDLRFSPHRTEVFQLLGSFRFVLGYAPDGFLDLEVGASVRSVRVVQD